MTQFTLYTHAQGPNGWKVVFVLRALGLSYTPVYLKFDKEEQKAPAHVSLNPNGRIPTLVDHQNGDFAVWESNAILQYLVAMYDKDHKISSADIKEQTQINQYLAFQGSGQGAYFGQAAHFKLFAPEKIEYGITRYTKEVARVSKVMNDILEKQPYLVGNKVTIADLAFVPWNLFALVALLPEGVDAKTEYPALVKWHEGLVALPYVAAGIAEKAAASA